jgi:chromosome segregation ATPase
MRPTVTILLEEYNKLKSDTANVGRLEAEIGKLTRQVLSFEVCNSDISSAYTSLSEQKRFLDQAEEEIVKRSKKLDARERELKRKENLTWFQTIWEV